VHRISVYDMSSNELLAHLVACCMQLHGLTDMTVTQLCCVQLTVLAGMVQMGLQLSLHRQLETAVH